MEAKGSRRYSGFKGLIMEDTCNPHKCALLDSLDIGDPSYCPNYMESLWSQENSSRPLLVKDCCPKRQLLMMQDIYNRLFAVQQTQTEQRNAASVMADAIMKASKNKQIGEATGHDISAIPHREL